MLHNSSHETASDPIQTVDLVREYARLTPPAHLQPSPAFAGAFNRVHDVLLHEILLDPHLRAYPPAPEYQLKFLKWAVQELETLLGDEDSEIDQRIYDRLVELIQSTPNSQLPARGLSPPSPSYITHYLRLSPDAPDTIHRVTLLESRTTVEQGTTGLKTWPAAHTLAGWLGEHPEHVKGKRVLELGCGVGYLGLVVAAIQLNAREQGNSQSSIWLTDVNDVVLSRCRENLNLPCSELRKLLTNTNMIPCWQMHLPGTKIYNSGSWIGFWHCTQMEVLPCVI